MSHMLDPEARREPACLWGCSVANIIRLTRKVTLALWEAGMDDAAPNRFSSADNFESILTDSCCCCLPKKLLNLGKGRILQKQLGVVPSP